MQYFSSKITTIQISYGKTGKQRGHSPPILCRPQKYQERHNNDAEKEIKD
jgi:hypothetical protein